MPIAENTRQEIETVLDTNFRLPNYYHTFLVKWLAFNRAYNDLEAGRDYEKVLAVGERLKEYWDEVSELAVQLVSLECIGSNRVENFELLRPDEWVKSATLYLRGQLNIEPSDNPQVCEFAACRLEKRRLCNEVKSTEWQGAKMAALLRLVYQVRCNLVHGDKRLADQDLQTARDHRLIQISTNILDRVLELLLEKE
jgi:hypothetical protein